MPFFFLSIYFRPFIDRALEAQSQNYPAKGRHSDAFTYKVSVKQSKNHSRQICYRSLTQRACRLPLSLFVALMASEHPEVRLYLCHQQPLLGPRRPYLNLSVLTSQLCPVLPVHHWCHLQNAPKPITAPSRHTVARTKGHTRRRTEALAL